MSPKRSARAGRSRSTDDVARIRSLIKACAFEHALDALGRLARHEPRCAELPTLRDAIELQLGVKIGSALVSALARNRSNAVVHELVGRQFERDGNVRAAVVAYSNALAHQPDNTSLHIHLGNLNRTLGDFRAAIACYERAISLDPELVPALNNLSALLLDLDRISEATPILDRTFRLAPNVPTVLCNVARLERLIGKAEMAHTHLKRAVEVDPGHFDTIVALADVAEHLGLLDEANVWLAKAAALVPQDPRIALTRSRLARRDQRHDDGIQLIEAALRDDTPAPLAAEMHYLLGQFYDARDADIAFGHLQKANALTRLRLSSDSTGTYLETLIDRRMKFAAQPARPARPVARVAQRTPAFLVGFPRSGTTLLEQVLDSHPLIQAMPERMAADAMRRRLKELLTPGLAVDWRDSPEILKELEDEYYREVFRYMSVHVNRQLVDKMPFNLANVDVIAPVFPEARFILALRHPHDVVLSCFMQNFQLNVAMRSFLTIEGAADVYCEAMGLWLEAREALALKVHTIRYEDLVDNFVPETRRLLEFLGTGWDDAVLAHVEHAKTRHIHTPSYHQVTRPVYRTARFRWRRYAKHLEPVIERLRPFVERFGYASDSDDPASI